MQIYLSQFDPRWSLLKIGRTSLPLGRWGCAVTCLSMALADFDIFMLPDEIASHADWFNAEGKIIWEEAQKYLRQAGRFRSLATEVEMTGRSGAIFDRDAASFSKSQTPPIGSKLIGRCYFVTITTVETRGKERGARRLATIRTSRDTSS